MTVRHLRRAAREVRWRGARLLTRVGQLITIMAWKVWLLVVPATRAVVRNVAGSVQAVERVAVPALAGLGGVIVRGMDQVQRRIADGLHALGAATTRGIERAERSGIPWIRGTTEQAVQFVGRTESMVADGVTAASRGLLNGLQRAESTIPGIREAPEPPPPPPPPPEIFIAEVNGRAVLYEDPNAP
ncbi:MAG: hypothetical protein GEU81_14555, partial [Nitriliruptorales bacterium]|nr:hypothetical protein [Nitriliruptorales bacterium]